jgi:broad specificity phosphatase PhoE
MTRFLIVRHGQSVWNAAGRWQGRADPPLTDLGREQARQAAVALPDFDVLAASTLQRAHQTADAMASAHGIDQVQLDMRFMERDAGMFSGLTRAEIDRDFPGYLESGRWPEGWEYDETLIPRVRAGLDELADAHGDATVVVISHGGVIYALERLLSSDHVPISNLAGRWFDQDESGWLTLRERVHLLDAVSETTPTQI